MKFKAFKALRPAPGKAADVASVPYDVIDSSEARIMAEGNAESFLHIIKPEIDLPPETGTYDDAVYAKGAENLKKFQKQGLLVRDEHPALYVYSQTIGDHSQTGLVGLCHVQDYENNLIKKHEKTLQKKEDDRTRHVKTMRAHAGPVFLTYRGVDAIDAIVSEVREGNPDVDFEAEDGVRHTVWPLKNHETVTALFEEQVPCSYVADGHHRSASAARVAAELAGGDEDASANWFLCVLFPSDVLNILAYNRTVADLNDLSGEDFLEKVNVTFTVTEKADGNPESHRDIRMYVNGTWYSLTWDPDADADPVESLDVAVLQSRLLGPVLGIDDPKTNSRIGFVGGVHGSEGLKQRVDAGKAALAFAMYPVAIDQLLDVADAGRMMPPKSTWFEPKLRSGLLVNLIDG